MRKTEVETWVVYRTTAQIQRKQFASNAVCEQSDWHAMELAKPGYHTLIMSGIQNEAEAEKLARGTSGDPVKRAAKWKTAAVNLV